MPHQNSYITKTITKLFSSTTVAFLFFFFFLFFLAILQLLLSINFCDLNFPCCWFVFLMLWSVCCMFCVAMRVLLSCWSFHFHSTLSFVDSASLLILLSCGFDVVVVIVIITLSFTVWLINLYQQMVNFIDSCNDICLLSKIQFWSLNFEITVNLVPTFW